MRRGPWRGSAGCPWLWLVSSFAGRNRSYRDWADGDTIFRATGAYPAGERQRVEPPLPVALGLSTRGTSPRRSRGRRGEGRGEGQQEAPASQRQVCTPLGISVTRRPAWRGFPLGLPLT